MKPDSLVTEAERGMDSLCVFSVPVRAMFLCGNLFYQGVAYFPQRSPVLVVTFVFESFGEFACSV